MKNYISKQLVVARFSVAAFLLSIVIAITGCATESKSEEQARVARQKAEEERQKEKDGQFEQSRHQILASKKSDLVVQADDAAAISKLCTDLSMVNPQRLRFEVEGAVVSVIDSSESHVSTFYLPDLIAVETSGRMNSYSISGAGPGADGSGRNISYGAALKAFRGLKLVHHIRKEKNGTEEEFWTDRVWCECGTDAKLADRFKELTEKLIAVGSKYRS